MLYIQISKQNLSYFPSCKTVLQSCTSPGDCLTLAVNFISIIQWLQNEFCSTFRDFHKRKHEIQMIHSSFSIDIVQVPVQKLTGDKLIANNDNKDTLRLGNGNYTTVYLKISMWLELLRRKFQQHLEALTSANKCFQPWTIMKVHFLPMLLARYAMQFFSKFWKRPSQVY